MSEPEKQHKSVSELESEVARLTAISQEGIISSTGRGFLNTLGRSLAPSKGLGFIAELATFMALSAVLPGGPFIAGPVAGFLVGAGSKLISNIYKGNPLFENVISEGGINAAIGLILPGAGKLLKRVALLSPAVQSITQFISRTGRNSIKGLCTAIGSFVKGTTVGATYGYLDGALRGDYEKAMSQLEYGALAGSILSPTYGISRLSWGTFGNGAKTGVQFGFSKITLPLLNWTVAKPTAFFAKQGIRLAIANPVRTLATGTVAGSIGTAYCYLKK